jgi:hypothetical protein
MYIYIIPNNIQAYDSSVFELNQVWRKDTRDMWSNWICFISIAFGMTLLLSRLTAVSTVLYKYIWDLENQKVILYSLVCSSVWDLYIRNFSHSFKASNSEKAIRILCPRMWERRRERDLYPCDMMCVCVSVNIYGWNLCMDMTWMTQTDRYMWQKCFWLSKRCISGVWQSIWICVYDEQRESTWDMWFIFETSLF